MQKAPTSVPVTAAPVIAKTVPVRLIAIGNVEPYTTVAVKARVDGQIVGVHFKEGDEVTPGRGAVRDRSAAVRGDARSRRRPTCCKDKALLDRAREQEKRYKDLLAEEFHLARRLRPGRARTPRRRAATVRGDEAAIENAQAAARVLHDPLADHGLRRQDHDPAGQPGQGQRHRPAGDRSTRSCPIYVIVLGARAEPRRRSASTRPNGELQVAGDARQLDGTAGPGKLSFIDNTADIDDRHDQAQGRVSEHGQGAVARPVRQRRADALRADGRHRRARRRPCRTDPTASTCSSSSPT